MSNRSKDTCENYERPNRFIPSSPYRGFIYDNEKDETISINRLLSLASALHLEVAALRKRVQVLEGDRQSLVDAINGDAQ